MNQKEIKELIEFLIEKDIAEFELERGDVKMKMKRAQEAPQPQIVYAQAPALAAPVAAPAGAAATAQHEALAPSAPKKAAAEDEGVHIVKSPIVGTFYEAPSPGSPPFVKNGDQVQSGQLLCIIEAMKLMNEIEADASGEIVKKYVANGQPVEYGQPLFGIRTR